MNEGKSASDVEDDDDQEDVVETDASFESMGLDDDDDLVDRKAAVPEIDLEFEQTLQAAIKSAALISQPCCVFRHFCKSTKD